MSNCPSCGADRAMSGILYPARRLCLCEPRRCAHCTRPAAVVEHQQVSASADSALPAQSDRRTKFLCATHNTTSIEIAPVSLSAPAAIAAPPPPKKPKPVMPATEPKRKKSARPHISPVWTLSKPPPDAHSKVLVECAGCRGTHPMKDRCMFNGTRSECPSCGFHIYTHANEDAYELR
jgi:hypothetical protein